MERFVEGVDRRQVTLLPPCLDDHVTEEDPIRVVEPFVDELDLGAFRLRGRGARGDGAPLLHPTTMLKLYLYGYLNRDAAGHALGARGRAGRHAAPA